MLRRGLLLRCARIASRAAAARALHLVALRRQFKLTDIGEGITEVEVLKWHVRPGSAVKEFDKLCEVQSDKAAVEITSRFAGVIKALCVEEGKMARVGQPLVEFEAEPASGPGPAAATTTEIPAPVPPAGTSSNDAATLPVATGGNDAATGGNGKKLASPAVRHLARQSDIDLFRVVGTGKDGRVLKEDVVKFTSASVGAAAAAPTSGASPAAFTVVPVRGVRREMAKTMTASLAIPHLTLMEEVAVDAALAALDKRASLLSLLIKAASVALVDFPELNASYDAEASELRVYAQHNILVAVDSPKGLVTPAVADVRNKSIADIAADLQRLKNAAAGGTLTPGDFKNGTFTLSNIGSIGGTYATPLIAPPLVAIGAFGKARRTPRFIAPDSTAVVAQKVMAVSWAADHRVIDGATVAKFSNAFTRLVENPGHLLVGLK